MMTNYNEREHKTVLLLVQFGQCQVYWGLNGYL